MAKKRQKFSLELLKLKKRRYLPNFDENPWAEDGLTEDVWFWYSCGDHPKVVFFIFPYYP